MMRKISSGTIQQVDKTKPRNKCRKWRLCVHVDNKRRSKRFTGSVTDAKAALEEWKAELSKRPADGLTVAQYAMRWCDYREQSGQYSANTDAATRCRLEAWSKSPIGDMPLSEVRPADIEEAMLWVRDNAPKVGRLSGTSMSGHWATLRSMFRHAEAAGLVDKDPMVHVKPPKRDTKEREALSPLELELLLNRLDAMPVDGHVVAVYLMACLGLRRGEALGLMLEDVHDGMVHVHRSMSARTHKIGAVKTAAGVRTLPMPQRLVAKLKEWAAAREAQGIADAPTVCCMANGRPIIAASMHYWWKTHRDDLGCGGMVMHQLRHSNLTMMARALPSAFDLQRWAGWSDIGPARIYIHEDMDALVAAAASVLAETPRKRATGDENRR